MFRRISLAMIALGAWSAAAVQAGPAATPGVSLSELNRAATQVALADTTTTQLAAHHCGRAYYSHHGGQGRYYSSGYRGYGGHGYGGYGYGGYGPQRGNGYGGYIQYQPSYGGHYHGGYGPHYYGGYPVQRGSSFGLYIGF